jgi:hypothetical protein
MQLGMGLLQLTWVSDLVSYPVMNGFAFGAALIICAWDLDEAAWYQAEDLSGIPWSPVGARALAVAAGEQVVLDGQRPGVATAARVLACLRLHAACQPETGEHRQTHAQGMGKLGLQGLSDHHGAFLWSHLVERV